MFLYIIYIHTVHYCTFLKNTRLHHQAERGRGRRCSQATTRFAKAKQQRVKLHQHKVPVFKMRPPFHWGCIMPALWSVGAKAWRLTTVEFRVAGNVDILFDHKRATGSQAICGLSISSVQAAQPERQGSNLDSHLPGPSHAIASKPHLCLDATSSQA